MGAIAGHDRKHLGRECSALAQLRQMIDSGLVPADSASPAPVVAKAPVPAFEGAAAPEAGAWFAVPYVDKDRVPRGVIYDGVLAMEITTCRKGRFA